MEKMVILLTSIVGATTLRIMTLSIMTISITTFSMRGLFVTLSINDIQHK
jgi:hypothetical protein